MPDYYCPICNEECTIHRRGFGAPYWYCPNCGWRGGEVEYDGPDTVEEARGER